MSERPAEHARRLPPADGLRTEPLPQDWDVVVAGAGPGGAMAARGLARAGVRVLLVDRSPFPRWKVCGACLGPGALAALCAAGLGDLPDRLGAGRLRTMVVSGAGRTVRVRLGGSRVLSRAVLDGALADAARDAGAVFRAGTRASLVGPAGRRWRLRLSQSAPEGSGADTKVLVTARAVVDATGIGGGLGGRLVPKSLVRAKSRLGLGAVFAPDLVELPPGELHMMVRPEGYTGLVSLEDGRICAAAAVDFDAVRERAPEAVFADFLRGAPRVRRARGDGDAWQDLRPLEGWRGTPALTRARPPGAVPGLYVVGDASGYVEPFTGEGIGWALAEGAAVVPYVAGALEGRAGTGAAAWAGAAEAYTPGATRTCRILARGLRSPKLVELALDVLQRAPAAGELLVQRTSRVPSVPRPPAA